MNRRLATPVDNRQGLDPGLVAGLNAPPPQNAGMGVQEPPVAAPSTPRWCRVHGYGPCPARSSGTRLPSPTPTEEEEREIVHDIPTRGYSPAPTRVACARGDGLVFIPTPGRAMATAGAVTSAGASGSAGPGLDSAGTRSAPWTFGRSPAPRGEQGLFLLGTGGTAATDVAGMSGSVGPPDTGASRRLLFGRSIAAIDRRPSRHPASWAPASRGLASAAPETARPDHVVVDSSSDEEGSSRQRR